MSLAFDRKNQLARFHPGLKKRLMNICYFCLTSTQTSSFLPQINQKGKRGKCQNLTVYFDTFVRLASFKGAVAPWLYPYIKNTSQRCSFIIFSNTLQDTKCFFKYHNDIRGIQPITEHTENDVLKFWQMG